ncbi:MAG: hypothetical protein AAFU64_09830 [Bacteroidota bacterium]
MKAKTNRLLTLIFLVALGLGCWKLCNPEKPEKIAFKIKPLEKEIAMRSYFEE